MSRRPGANRIGHRGPAPWRLLLLTSQLRCRPCCVRSWAVLAALLVVSSPVAAQLATVEPVDGPWQFERVLVPKDAKDRWPTGNRRYVEIPRARFEQLVAAATGRGEPRPAAIRQGEYRARLEGTDLVGGTAVLEVDQRSSEATLLPLVPCGLVISNVRWDDDDGGEPLWGTDARGRAMLLVPKPGRLLIDWKLTGHRDEFGELVFDFAVPAGTQSRLILDLPADWTPAADQGAVIEGPLRHELRQDDKSSRWRVLLGAASRTTLRLRAAESTYPSDVALRQRTAYSVLPEGIDVAAKFELEVHQRELDQLTVQLEPPLRFVSAQLDDQPLPARVRSAAPGEPVLVEVPFSQPLRGARRQLVVRASAPREPRSAQRSRLPEVHVLEGELRRHRILVDVPPPLELTALAIAGGQQAPSDQLDVVAVDLFEADAAVEISVAARPARAEVSRSVTEIVLGPGEVTGRLVAELRCREGEVFHLSAEVSPEWLIDSVGPSAAIRRWELDQPDSKTGRRRLQLELVKPLSSGQSTGVRLEVTGRLLADSLDARRLRILRFVDVATGRQIVSVRPAESNELQISGGAALQRIDQELLGNDSDLFAMSPGDLLFLWDDSARDVEVGLQPQAPRYRDTSIEVRASVSRGKLTETYWLKCKPSTEIDRLLVRFSQAREEDLHWALVLPNDNSTALDARRIGRPSLLPEGWGGAAEVWEVTLPRPMSEKLDLLASRVSPLMPSTAVSLAALPRQAAQQGILSVRVLDDTPLVIENRRLAAIPSLQPPNLEVQTLRGTFRYQPDREVSSPDGAIRLVTQDRSDVPPAAWVWACQSNVRHGARGPVDHADVFRIQSSGRATARITLPEGAELRSVWLDGQPLTPRQLASGEPGTGPSVLVELPPRGRFPVVQVGYTTPAEPLGLTRYVAPRWARIDLPVLNHQVAVWIPRDYKAVDSARGASWPRRLFGPLAREPGQAAFDLFDERDWRDLVNTRGPASEATSVSDQVLESLDAHRAEVRTWAQWLAPAQTALESQGLTLEMDAAALDAVGIRPSSPFSYGSDGPRTPLETGDAAVPRGAMAGHFLAIDSLKRAGLVLVLRPTTAVVTTAVAVQRAGEPMVTVVDQVAFLQAPTSQGQSNSRHVTFAAWRNGALVPELPWTDRNDVENRDVAAAAWRVVTFSVGEDHPGAEVDVVHTGKMSLVGWSLVLLVAAIWWWFAKSIRLVRRFAMWIVLLIARTIERRGLAGRARVLVGRARHWLPGLLRGAPWIALPPLAALALLVSPVYIPVFSALILGTILAIGLLACVPRQLGVRSIGGHPATLSSRRRRELVTASAGLLMALALCAATGGTAAEPDSHVRRTEPTSQTDAASESAPKDSVVTPATSNDGPDQAATAPFQVLVPSDSRQQPSGDTLWVPQSLYDALRLRAADVQGRPRGWLLTAATYSAALEWDQPAAEVVLGGMKARWDLYSFERSTSVELPVARADVLPGQASVRLDGQPATASWDEAGKLLSVGVAASGPHRLEVLMRPMVRDGGEIGTADIDVPLAPHPAARLNLQAPSQLRSIQIGTRGNRRTLQSASDPQAATSFLLGPQQSLALGWNRAADDSQPPAFDVEESMWITADAHGTQVDVRLRLLPDKSVQASLRTLDLVVDRRLTFVPPASESVLGPPRHFERGDFVELSFPLKRPVTGETIVSLQFRLVEASPLGLWRRPHLSIPLARQVDRWLAVSLADSLAARPPQGSGFRAVKQEAFVQRWGATLDEPNMAFHLEGDPRAWSLRVAAAPSKTLVKGELLSLDLDGRGANVDYRADLRSEFRTNKSAPRYYYVVRVPDSLQIDVVEVLEQGIVVPSRFVRTDKSHLTVFVAGDVGADQRLRIVGRLLIDSRDRWSTPQLQLQDAQLTEHVLRIRRRPDVLVELVDHDGYDLLDDPASDSPAVLDEALDGAQAARLVAVLKRGAGESGRVHLKLTDNAPRVAARQVTTLGREGDTWKAQVDYVVQRVEGGVLDEVQFEIPAEWSNPERINPPTDNLTRPIRGTNRRLLTFRPPQAITQQQLPMHLSFHLRPSPTGREPSASSLRAHLPRVIAQGNFESYEQFVVLPSRAGNQQIQWETADMTATDLPPDAAASALIDPGARMGFRVDGPAPDAYRKSVQQAAEEPLIRLADVHFAWDKAGHGFGAVAFDIDPAGTQHCRLQLPPGVRWIAVSVAGAPVHPVPDAVDHRTWQIPLAFSQLPQRLEVIYTATLSAPDPGPRELPAPRLVSVRPINVERTLWTVYTPGEIRTDAALQGKRIDGATVAQERLRSVESLLRDAAEVATEQLDVRLAGWYVPWARRVLASSSELDRQRAMQHDSRTAHGLTATSPLPALESLSASMNMASAYQQLTAAPLVATGGPELLEATVSGIREPAYFTFTGEAPTLTVTPVTPPPSDLPIRLLAALGLLSLGGTIAWWCVRRPKSSWPCRSVQLSLVVLGLGWWLLLVPSILGWLIVLAALLLPRRKLWPGVAPSAPVA